MDRGEREVELKEKLPKTPKTPVEVVSTGHTVT
jgi:hypothetical protein